MSPSYTFATLPVLQLIFFTDCFNLFLSLSLSLSFSLFLSFALYLSLFLSFADFWATAPVWADDLGTTQGNRESPISNLRSPFLRLGV